MLGIVQVLVWSFCFWGAVAANDNSDSVRLVSGRSLCSGSLQIWDQSLSRSWTWVCEGALDRVGAEVLCRELGCGPPLLQGELSPLRQTFHCEGHESALMDCPRKQTRTNPQTCSRLNVTCSELRLVGGASRCEGTVEVKHNGEWRRAVTSDLWDLQKKSTVCEELDCGSVISAGERQKFNISDVWSIRFDCLDYDVTMSYCVDFGSSGHEGLQLVCSDSVRLVSGQTSCSGSLQIWDQSLSRSWIWVCEGELDRVGAEVLCRELGCGPPLLQGELSPLGQTFHCEGHESALLDCPRKQTRTDPETCSKLNLTCSDLRLVGGAGRCEGTVEVKHNGEWRRAVTFDLWDLQKESAVCRELDCGSVVSAEEREGFKISDVWSISFYCLEDDVTETYCVDFGSSGRDDGLQLVCSDSLRLVSGQTSCSGSLKIWDQSLGWTWVCEGALDHVGAEVLCRELGCGPPLLQGELSPLGQTFHCEGHESALMDCPRKQTRSSQTCSRLSLTCSELRLVGGTNRCEGTVEVKHRGEWRRVVPYGLWDMQFANVTCQKLNCGSYIHAEHRKGFSISDVWVINANCLRDDVTVSDCVAFGSSGDDEGLQVECSGPDSRKIQNLPMILSISVVLVLILCGIMVWCLRRSQTGMHTTAQTTVQTTAQTTAQMTAQTTAQMTVQTTAQTTV